MTIKEIFDKATGPIDFSTFEKLMAESGAKFADLSEGKYVSKDKFDNEVSSREGTINKLNETLKERDKDLKNLKTQLTDAGTDSKKLEELQTQFGNLQTQYKTDTENYKAQLGKQAYEFAVKEFASGKKFTSNAAKRDFINSMIAGVISSQSTSYTTGLSSGILFTSINSFYVIYNYVFLYI